MPEQEESNEEKALAVLMGISFFALLAAAVAGSAKALEEARERDMSVMIEENGALYYLKPDGSKVFIRHLDTPRKRIPTSKFSIG